jgi:hypothetical protein
MSAWQEISIVNAYEKIANLGKEEKDTLDRVVDYAEERGTDAGKESVKHGFLAVAKEEIPHSKDVFKGVRNSIIKGALKEHGGLGGFIAWAWDGADALKVLLAPEPPIVKVIEVGFFLEDVFESLGKKIIQMKTDAMMAEMMKDLDPVFVAYGTVRDKIVKEAKSLFPEADGAGHRILPLYTAGVGADWIRQYNDPRTLPSVRRSLGALLGNSVLWNLEYLRKLRYRLFMVKLMTVGFFFDCETAAETGQTAVADYQGYVHPMRKKQFEAGMRAMYTLNSAIQVRQSHLYNLSYNLWTFVGNAFGVSFDQARMAGEL